MGQHYINNGRDIHKKGLAVDVKPTNHPEAHAKAVEQAIRTLKRRMIQEGVVRDLRKHEYAETKGQKRRKAFAEAKRRAARAKRLAK
jgi:ribosomal protein S21